MADMNLNPKHPLKVFLCHAHADRDIVRELYHRLKDEGWIDPWLDEEKLFPGMNWDMEIEKAVEVADAVIVCLSNNSITKEGYVQKELRSVLDVAEYKPDGAIFIIPLRLEDCFVPRRLKSYQYQDYFPAEQIEKATNRLLNSLKIRADVTGVNIPEILNQLRIEEEEKAKKALELRIRKEAEEKIHREEEETIRIKAEERVRKKIERKSRKEAEEQARQNATKERESAETNEREKAEKAARKRAELEASEKTAQEEAERQKAEKAAQEKAAQEEFEKEIQHETEKIIKKAKRDLWWGKFKIDIHYRFQVIYIYRIPILILLVTLAIAIPLSVDLYNKFPELTQALNVTPTTATTLIAIPSNTNEPSQTPTNLLTSTATKTNTPTVTPIPTSSILFQKNFEDNALGEWSNKDGVWAIDQEPDGNHCLAGSGPAAGTPQIWYKNDKTYWTDYVLETRVKFIKGHTLYILIRSDVRSGEHYGVALNDVGFSLMHTWSIMSDNISMVLAPNKWHTIRAEISGDSFSAYIDNDVFLKSKLYPPIISQGGFGYVIDKGVNACFDDIKAWSLK